MFSCLLIFIIAVILFNSNYICSGKECYNDVQVEKLEFVASNMSSRNTELEEGNRDLYNILK